MKTSSPKLVVPIVSEHESGSRVEHLQPLLERVVHGPARRQLDDQRGGPPDRVDRLASAARSRASAGARRRGCAGGSSPHRRPRTARPSRPAPRSWSAAPGTSAFADSAPVGATVIRVRRVRDPGGTVMASSCQTRRRPHRPTHDRRIFGMRASSSGSLQPRSRSTGRSPARSTDPACSSCSASPTPTPPRWRPRWPRKIWELRIMADEQSARRPRRRRARRQPVHPVRRHPQGPPPVLVGGCARSGVGAALRGVLRSSARPGAPTSRPARSVAHMDVSLGQRRPGHDPARHRRSEPVAART